MLKGEGAQSNDTWWQLFYYYAWKLIGALFNIAAKMLDDAWWKNSFSQKKHLLCFVPTLGVGVGSHNGPGHSGTIRPHDTIQKLT